MKAPIHSQGVDLDQITARLLATLATRPDTTTRRDLSPTPPLSPPGSAERRLYEALVRAGGRPSYPIEKLEDVMNEPRGYRDVLRPWVYHVDSDPSEWEVFQRQLTSWEAFCEWQKAYMDDSSKTAQRAVDNAVQHFNRQRRDIHHSSTYANALERFQAKQCVQGGRKNAEDHD